MSSIAQVSNPPSARVQLEVCICTYNRPSVVHTLRSVAAQVGVDSSYDLHVIVADNADTPVARQSIEDEAAALNLSLLYVHAPSRNISVARNACLDAARGAWLAFLDDDEVASPHWLRDLLDEADRGGWDAVLGPVHAVYPPAVPKWLPRGDFHSTRPVWVGGRIQTGYCGNLLLRRATIQRHALRFKIELGRSGGEDTEFLYRFVDLGGRIGFSKNAAVSEPVPPSRASLKWLVRRSFRWGQTHGARLRAAGVAALPINLALAIFKAGFCAFGAALNWARPVDRNRFITRCAMHGGVLTKLMGSKEITLY